MKEQGFYSQVEKAPKKFLTFAIITILSFSGLSFTFVIPGLKGFSLFFMIVTLLMYFLVANIFVGIIKDKTWFVFFGSLFLSSLGMGWRLWLEWGEYSLVEHMNVAVIVGYPSIIALIITTLYGTNRAIYDNKAS